MGTGASQPPTPPMKKQPETVPKKKYDDVVKKLEAVQKELQALKMSKGVEQQNTLRDIPHGKVTLGVSAGEKYPAEMTPGKRALECPVAVMTDSYKATHPWIYPEAQRYAGAHHVSALGVPDESLTSFRKIFVFLCAQHGSIWRVPGAIQRSRCGRRPFRCASTPLPPSFACPRGVSS